MFGKARRFGRRGAGFAPRTSALNLSASAPSASSGIERVQLFGHDQAQHPVAQEFQPLVGARRARAGMGQRALQKARDPGKRWPSCAFERVATLTSIDASEHAVE